MAKSGTFYDWVWGSKPVHNFGRDAVKQFRAAYAACPGPCARLVSVDSTDIVSRSDACEITRRAAPWCRCQPLCVQRSPQRAATPCYTAPSQHRYDRCAAASLR